MFVPENPISWLQFIVYDGIYIKKKCAKTTGIMPKNKNKNQRELMTGSLKVKPKKRPGLVKQLSQPFFSSKNKKKNGDFPEPVVLISRRSKDDMVLLNGYDDMFIPDISRNCENIFSSPDTDEDNIEFDRCPLKIKMPPREHSSGSDSGYTSPPCPNDVCSPTSTTPAKGILKKLRPWSPIGRCDSPSPGLLSSDENILSQSEPALNTRPMSPFERAISPLGLEFESALDILDDIIDQETLDSDKKAVKKSVSFGELPEVKKYFSDSSDNDIGDGIKLFKKSVSTGDIDVMHFNETLTESKPVKKSVSFDAVSPVKSNENVKKSVSFDDIVTMETDSSVSERSDSDSDGCTCDKVCTFEVEVKIVDIQPQGQQVQSDLDGHDQGQGETCKELEKFNIMVRWASMNKIVTIVCFRFLWSSQHYIGHVNPACKPGTRTVHILSPVTDNYPSWISRSGRMVHDQSLQKIMLLGWGLNLRL